jgi:hypothetical protein
MGALGRRVMGDGLCRGGDEKMVELLQASALLVAGAPLIGPMAGAADASSVHAGAGRRARMGASQLDALGQWVRYPPTLCTLLLSQHAVWLHALRTIGAWREARSRTPLSFQAPLDRRPTLNEAWSDPLSRPAK